jgi:hypothetical protein
MTQPTDGILVTTTSIPNLAEMILRARSDADRSAFEMNELMERVAGEDAWLYTADLSGTIERLHFEQASGDVRRMLESVRRAAASLRIEQERAVFTLYLEPRAGIATEDLSDLVRGLVALLKLDTNEHSSLKELAERIRVSDDGPYARVRIELEASEIQDLFKTGDRR